MSEPKLKQHIASHLKSIRATQGFSLDATAKATGVSKAMLGQIERQESSPTIATLWKIANGLNTSFSAFFVAPKESSSNEQNTFNDSNMRIKALFPYQNDTKMEVFEVTLLNYHEQSSSSHNPGMIEHVHVISGVLSLFCNGQWHELKDGDSMRFFADQPHIYKAATQSTIFHNIICY